MELPAKTKKEKEANQLIRGTFPEGFVQSFDRFLKQWEDEVFNFYQKRTAELIDERNQIEIEITNRLSQGTLCHFNGTYNLFYRPKGEFYNHGQEWSALKSLNPHNPFFVPNTRLSKQTQTYSINLEGILEFAKQIAASTVQNYLYKLCKKIGTVENLKVHAANRAGDFKVSGMLKGQKVEMLQKVIWNYSIRGKAFYQFPSRIYLEDKFIPAKKFDVFARGKKAEQEIKEAAIKREARREAKAEKMRRWEANRKKIIALRGW